MYRIGEASTLSGVSIDSIRAWERRYQAVTPSRDGGNIRLYSENDVARLKAMQQLVNRGARISDIASLDSNDLQQRLSPNGVSTKDLNAPVPLVLVGPQLPEIFAAMPGQEFKITTTLSHSEELDEAFLPPEAFVILQYDMDENDRLKRMVQDIHQSGVRMIVLLYQFAPTEILKDFRKRGVVTMRLTTDAAELRQALLSRHYWDYNGRPDRHQFLYEPVPESEFSDAQLIRARNISTNLACDCPAHLAELISALRAFEHYSQQCENKTAADAATHAMLRAASGHARGTMEAALLRLAEDDGLLERIKG